ncbi:MAG TPA: L-threonylcarbamoyladenylate synthase [Burkholderiales bacterium]|nr:L-threonylcarbamoyladenylate synthase [Burkholderiales bacterium]
MAQLFAIHPTHPQPRLVRRAAGIVRDGGLIAYPTDSCYALGCAVDAPQPLARLRRVRGIDERHHLTLMCRSVAEVAAYAMVGDQTFRFLKMPGSYTFILPARRQVPRRVMRKKTIGVRMARHPVALALLDELDAPILTATLLLPGDAAPLSHPEEIRGRLERDIDLVVDSGDCGTEPSTIIDLTGAAPVVLRPGKGSLAPFTVESV